MEDVIMYASDFSCTDCTHFSIPFGICEIGRNCRAVTDILIGRQVAARPNRDDDDPYKWFCPTCGSIIGTDGQDIGNNYCCDCGQALNWSEWETEQEVRYKKYREDFEEFKNGRN